MNNATLSTIRGLKAGYAGQQVTIVSIGAGQVDLAHQNANSAANNRQINYMTSAPTPLKAGVGSATYQYDGTTLRWRLVSHNQGGPITRAFDAADFTGSGSMTWTVDSGDVFAYDFMLVGRQMLITIDFDTTTIGGTASSALRFAIPLTGASPTKAARQVLWVNQAGITSLGVLNVLAAVTYIQITKNFDGDNWTLNTNNVHIAGQLYISVD
jgi:hypothetical protein